MTILQVNSVCGYGSTGRICTDLAWALHAQDHTCYIAYGQFATDFVNSFKIGTLLENHLHNACSRLIGKQGYYTKRGTRKLIGFIKCIRPDVIHLHNLHGNFLNLRILFEYLAQASVPVVWTLHDCWPFTGKCAHYSRIGCYKWQSHCRDCPQVGEYPPSVVRDCSEEMFADKSKWFTSMPDLTIVTVSNWLLSQVKLSFLSKYRAVSIYNWIDRTVFRPVKGDLKREFRVPPDKFVVLTVGANWRKGSSKLADLLALSKVIPVEMQIVTVGNVGDARHIPSNVIHIPYEHDARALAQIYSMADAFVHLSAEDTFGKVIAEALACGTPAVVYNTTGCPEVIGPRCGYVVGMRDVHAVYDALRRIKTDGKRMYSSACVQHVRQHFDLQDNTEKTIQIYKSVLK